MNYADVLNAWITAQPKRGGKKVEGFCVDGTSKGMALKTNSGRVEWIVTKDYRITVNTRKMLKRDKPDWPGASG